MMLLLSKSKASMRPLFIAFFCIIIVVFLFVQSRIVTEESKQVSATHTNDSQLKLFLPVRGDLLVDDRGSRLLPISADLINEREDKDGSGAFALRPKHHNRKVFELSNVLDVKPIITAITSSHKRGSYYKFPPSGEIDIFIHGTNFIDIFAEQVFPFHPANILVTINSNPCTNIRMLNRFTIACILPLGIGANLPLVVTGVYGRGDALFTYDSIELEPVFISHTNRRKLLVRGSVFKLYRSIYESMVSQKRNSLLDPLDDPEIYPIEGFVECAVTAMNWCTLMKVADKALVFKLDHVIPILTKDFEIRLNFNGTLLKTRLMPDLPA